MSMIFRPLQRFSRTNGDIFVCIYDTLSPSVCSLYGMLIFLYRTISCKYNLIFKSHDSPNTPYGFSYGEGRGFSPPPSYSASSFSQGIRQDLMHLKDGADMIYTHKNKNRIRRLIVNIFMMSLLRPYMYRIDKEGGPASCSSNSVCLFLASL